MTAARPSRSLRWLLALALAVASTAAALAWLPGPVPLRAGLVAGLALALWLSECVPVFVPALLLPVAAGVALGEAGPSFGLRAMLGAMADPVVALFLGGFALAQAARRHGLDAWGAAWVVRAAQGSARRLAAGVALGTAFLSMWMSNLAAAALVVTALRPLLAGPAAAREPRLPRALLLAVALGANLGGMATPLGSGPNALAVAEARLSFARWVAFALPLALGSLALGLLLLLGWRVRLGHLSLPAAPPPAAAPSREGRAVLALAAVAVALWLSEPWHGVSAPAVALAAAGLLFALGLLAPADLGRLDWGTLLMVGGGLALGHLLEDGGVLAALLPANVGAAWPAPVRRAAWVLLAALLSALMSNTATAALLLPVAARLDPGPETAVLVALGCSFGMPFVISTPPNALVHGEGARSADLLALGLPLMLGGCLWVALTGPWVLRLFGVG